MPYFKTIAIAFIVLIFLSCSKGGETTTDVKDTSPPVITITSPTSNQQFSAGQSIQVNASATDNVKVTEMHIHVLNKATGALFRDVHAYPDGKSGNVQDGFAAQSGVAYIVRIIANDPSQNIATAQVEVSVN